METSKGDCHSKSNIGTKPLEEVVVQAVYEAGLFGRIGCGRTNAEQHAAVLHLEVIYVSVIAEGIHGICGWGSKKRLTQLKLISVCLGEL